MKVRSVAILVVASLALSHVCVAKAQETDSASSDDALMKLLEETVSDETTSPTSASQPAEDGSAASANGQNSGATPDVAPATSSATTDAALLPTIPLPQKPKSVPELPREKRNPMIEEIVVSAQRRAENAQEVPISITVFSAKQLSNANITNSSDLAVYTPSLSTNTRFGADNATFSIRGFTQELRTTPSVATYMAEVVAPRGQSSQTSGDGAGPGAMFDLANVQVLKGPQGTLFGRNTTGGAVLLVPNRPGEEFEGYVEMSGGEWGMFRQQGVFNVPVSDDFKIRFGIDRNERDGHLNNITKIGASKLGSVDYLSMRLSTLWDISDTLENYTIVSSIDSQSTGYTAQLYACNPDYIGSDVFLLFSGSLQSEACQAQLDRQAAAGQNDFYDVVSTIKSPKTNIKEKRLINTLIWKPTDEIVLKNILAYGHLHTENGSDIFGVQFPYNLVGLPVDPDPNREFKIGVSIVNPDVPVTSQTSYVAELQLQGVSYEGDFEWQGGVYWEKSLPDGFSGNNSAGLISCNLASLEGDPSGFDCYDPLFSLVGGVLVQKYKTTYLNRAAYSHATWHLNDEWSVTGGLRYTWDKTKGYGIKTRYTWALAVPLAPSTEITTPEVSSKAPTGLLELNWKPFEGQMIYAKYLRGYRQGSVILAADPGIDTFEPEKVDTYELGLKTEFGGPIPGRFNLAAFYNDFTNQQLQLGYISPTATQTTTIVNAGKSRIQGVEGEAFFQLHENLSLALSFSLLDTVLLEQTDLTDRVGQAGGPLAMLSVTPIAEQGDELPYAPDQTYVTSLTWRVPVPEIVGEIDLGVTYSQIGKQRSAASSSGPFGVLPAFDLLNVNASWARIFNTPLDIVVFGTNILGEKYVTYTSGGYNLLSFESRSLGTPRMIGARLKYNFGAAAQ